MDRQTPSFRLNRPVAGACAALLAASALAAPAAAEPVARYVFAGEDPTLSSDKDSATEAGKFKIGPGLEADYNRDTVSDGGAPVIFAKGHTTAASEDEALTAEDYFSFTVTPGDQPLNLAQLTLEASASWGNATHYGFAVYTSVDGFDSADAHVFSTGEVVAPNTQFKQYKIDLSADKFQGLTEPIEVRIYVWDGAKQPFSQLRLDTIVLHGRDNANP